MQLYSCFYCLTNLIVRLYSDTEYDQNPLNSSHPSKNADDGSRCIPTRCYIISEISFCICKMKGWLMRSFRWYLCVQVVVLLFTQMRF